MKNRYLLSTLLTFMFCCFMTSVDAQCTKTKKSCSKNKTEQTKKSCTKSKSSCTKSYSSSSCSKYKKENCGKKNSSSWNNLNTLVFLGGAAFDNDSPTFATGLEYERQVSNNVGLGLLSEVSLGETNTVKVGIPISYHLGKFKISGAPMGAFYQDKDTTNHGEGTDGGSSHSEEETSMEMEIGARAGVSYLMNVRGLVIAPTARVDILDESVVPSVGVNVGFGF